jgi:hypothetical protein
MRLLFAVFYSSVETVYYAQVEKLLGAKYFTMSAICNSAYGASVLRLLLVGKPEGKRPLGRPRHRWMDNIKMDLREIGWDGKDWIDLAQDRDQWRALVNTVMNLRVP